MRLFSGTDYHRWLSARPTSPTLLLFDACALITLLGSTFLVSAQNTGLTLDYELATLRRQHAEQMEALIRQSNELEAQMETQTVEFERVLENATMEHQKAEAAAHEQRASELEDLRRATELRDEAIHRLKTQMDAQAKQMEAVNLALQYHRAELTQLRQGMRALQQLEPVNRAAVPRLTSEEYQAISAPSSEKAVVSEKESPFSFLTTAEGGTSEKRLSPFSTIEPQRIAPEERAG